MSAVAPRSFEEWKNFRLYLDQFELEAVQDLKDQIFQKKIQIEPNSSETRVKTVAEELLKKSYKDFEKRAKEAYSEASYENLLQGFLPSYQAHFSRYHNHALFEEVIQLLKNPQNGNAKS